MILPGGVIADCRGSEPDRSMENQYEVEVVHRQRAIYRVQANDREEAERLASERWRQGDPSDLPGYDWSELVLTAGRAAADDRDRHAGLRPRASQQPLGAVDQLGAAHRGRLDHPRLGPRQGVVLNLGAHRRSFTPFFVAVACGPTVGLLETARLGAKKQGFPCA